MTTPNNANEARKWALVNEARRRAHRADRPTSASTFTVGEPFGPPSEGAPAALQIPGYELHAELHRGGQGVVYRATQKSTSRMVAIKLLHGGQHAGVSDRARFEREVQILGALKHPNIVQIHDSGSIAGAHYYVMDYVVGKPVDEWISDQRDSAANHGKTDGLRSGNSPEGSHTNAVLRLFIKVCDALNVAHLRGIIHRDLKPGNILVDPSGEPHILDFGLAKVAEFDVLAGDGSPTMTHTGQFVGSVPWSAPEQADGVPGRIDIRTDVYALGVMLYRALTGRFPYEVYGNIRYVLEQIVNVEPAPMRLASARSSGHSYIFAVVGSWLRRSVYSIDDEIETIVLKCLAKEPQRRYQSAGDLAADLRHYLNSEPIVARPPTTIYQLRKFAKRNKALVSGVAATFLTLLLGIIGTGFGLLRERDARRSEAEQRAAAERLGTAVAHRAYAANIAAAESALRLDDVSLARSCLREARAIIEAYQQSQVPAPFGRFSSPNWEWQYLSNQTDYSITSIDLTNRLEQTSEGAEGIGAATISRDGSLLAMIVGQTRVLLVDVESGNTRAVFVRPEQDFRHGLAFSPDAARLAITDTYHQTISVLDVATGERVLHLLGHSDAVHSVCFAPDGRSIISSASDHTARVWDANTGTQTTVFRLANYAGTALSPDGTQLATCATDGTIQLWDFRRRAQLLNLNMGRRSGEIAFSRDGRRLACSTGDTIQIRDTTTGQILHVLRGGHGSTERLAWNEDGSLLANSNADATIQLWNSESGELLTTLRGHTGHIRLLTFHTETGDLISVADDATIRFWDSMQTEAAAVCRGQLSDCATIAFSPDGRALASIGRDATVRIWDALTGEQSATLSIGFRPISALAFIRQDLLAIGSADGLVHFWNPASDHEVSALRVDGGWVRSVAIADGGTTLFTFGDDRRVRKWDLSARKKTAELAVAGDVKRVIFSRDQTYLATTHEPEALSQIWDIRHQRVLFCLNGHSAIAAVAFSRDGRQIATGSNDGTVVLYDAGTGQKQATLRGHRSGVTGIEFSPDSSRLASSSTDGTVKLWDTSGMLLVNLTGHVGWAYEPQFSLDGRRLAAGSPTGEIRVWDVGGPRPRLKALRATRRARAEAPDLVARLFCDGATSEAVIARLNSDESLAPDLREAALHLVRTRSGRPEIMTEWCWSVLVDPYRAPSEYSRAGAMLIEGLWRAGYEDGDHFTLIGAARFRRGRLMQALEDLEEGRRRELSNPGRYEPANLAFAAMALHALGCPDEVNATLQQMHNCISEQECVAAEVLALAQEAEQLAGAVRTGQADCSK